MRIVDVGSSGGSLEGSVAGALIAATRTAARKPQAPTPSVDEQRVRPYSVPWRELVPTSVPTFPWRRETPGYASKRSTYWNL